MLTILIGSILAILGLFTGLTVLIIVGKGGREIVTAWRRRRRQTIEPEVLRYAHGSIESLLPALGGRMRLQDRAVVEEVLLDHVQRVRGIEQQRLGRALDELGFVERHIEGLRSPRWWRRADAAEKLGLAGARRAREALVAALDDDMPEVRIRAAKALGLVGGAASALPLIAALKEPNRWSTIRIADILAEIGQPVTRELMHAFPELSIPARLAALDILGRIRPLESAPWLRDRLHDPERDVRARAAHALGAIGEPGSGPALAAALDDADWPVRAMAAKALGRVHWQAAIPELCRALRDPEWWVRANAAEALRSLGDSGLVALDRMLDDGDRYARHQAVLMMQEAGELDRRVENLASYEADEVSRAKAWLLRVARAGQDGRLRELAERHRDPEVRGRLESLLAEEHARRAAAESDAGGAP